MDRINVKKIAKPRIVGKRLQGAFPMPRHAGRAAIADLVGSVDRLPGDLSARDRHAGRGANRSEFIETAVRRYIAALVRRKQSSRDLTIINRRARRLNRDALDVLDYQIPVK